MMVMGDYLTEIEYAAENLISILWREDARLKELEKELQSLMQRTEEDYQRAERAAMNAETPDDVAEAAGMYWDTYFGVDKDRYYKDQARAKFIERLVAIRLSLDSVAGSLLQYAKQGISLCHGGLGACPSGRALGSQSLKNVIWQGRNQALHWEDHQFHNATQQCFDKLSSEVDSKFEEYIKRNMAVDVVTLLGWTDFSKFKADMLSLA